MEMHFLVASEHSHLGWYTVRVGGGSMAVVLFTGTRQRLARERCNHAIFRVSLGQSVTCNYRVNEAEPRRWFCFVL